MLNFKKLTGVFLILLMLSLKSYAQDNNVAGKVIDEKTGQGLLNAVVTIDSTQLGSITDWNGDFQILDVPVGLYNVTIKMVGYSSKRITGVEVKKGQAAQINVAMVKEEKQLGTVFINSKLNQESTNALRIIQKNSASMADGMTADNIKRTPDKSTADVLKRVSGVSIQDNKFAIVRGLNERYNVAFLNGSPLPSSEPDRKAFAFDIFPSNMLDNILIFKTAIPELPGEFAGGVININTKDIPDNNFQTIAISGAYNSLTTFKDQMTYPGGKLDWLGVDDGTRAIPSTIPTYGNFSVKVLDQAALAKTFTSDWRINNKTFAPNSSLQYSLGRSYKLNGKGRTIGFVFALTHSSSFNYQTTQRNSYTNNSTLGTDTSKAQLDHSYLDQVYSQQVLGGSLLNLAFKVNTKNIITLKTLYTINSDNRLVHRTGVNNPFDVNPILLMSNARMFTSNQIASAQLQGDHYIQKSKIKFLWNVGISDIVRDIPSERRSVYTRNKYLTDPSTPNPLDTQYVANISLSSVGPDYGGGMFWYHNLEKMRSAKIQLSKAATIGKVQVELKSGLSYQFRNRTFTARRLGYTKYSSAGGGIFFNDSLAYLPEDEIFSNANMGLIKPGVGGFKLVDDTRPSDRYTASSTLTAGFVQADLRWHDLRVITGARVENFRQTLNAQRNRNRANDIKLDTSILDVLPSLNLVYTLNPKNNLRASYAHTLNRPEYRELAPFAFYDFNTQFVVSGRDTLKRALIKNYDLRYESFPGKGQVFSVGAFYKQFYNPIEQVSSPYADKEISFSNIPNANLYGAELEFRYSFNSLFTKDTLTTIQKMVSRNTFFTNLTIVKSKVETKSILGAISDSRPLQGQSPYVVNAGWLYQDVEHNFTTSVVLNRVGQRIFLVGNVNDPEIWEKARTFLDVQIAKQITKSIELKVNVQNILAQDQIFYQNDDYVAHSEKGFVGRGFNNLVYGDPYNEFGYQVNRDNIVWKSNFPRIFSLGLSIKL